MRGHSESDGWESQYQEENLPRTWVRGFGIPIGRCMHCARRVQGRHRLQTSGALEAAAVQGGPEEAVTLGVLRNKFVGCETEATWDALRDAAHRSELAHVDERGKVQASCAGHGQ